MRQKNKIATAVKGASLALVTLLTVSFAGQAQARRGHGPGMGGEGPPHRKLFRLMKQLDLRTDQRVAVESLAKDMKLKAAPMRKLHKKVAAEVAAGVRAGKIDKARVQARIKQARTQARSLKPEFLSTLNKLHAILDQEQRVQLVEQIKEKRHKRHKLFRGKHRGKMRKLARELNLTDAQKDQLRSAMWAQFKNFKKDRAAMRGKWRQRRADAQAAAQAFTSEGFDARNLAFFQKAPGMARHKGQRMIAMSDSLLPILTETQREQLATIIEKRAARMGKRSAR